MFELLEGFAVEKRSEEVMSSRFAEEIGAKGCEQPLIYFTSGAACSVYTASSLISKMNVNGRNCHAQSTTPKRRARSVPGFSFAREASLRSV
jgi:uncharacterized OsmC-like protein